MKVRDIVMREDAKITKSDGSGVEITADDGVKTTLPADKAAAIMPDPEKPGEYDFNPQAVAQSASGGQPTGPAVGANVEIKTAEAAGDIETIPTQEFVKGIYSVAAEYGSEAPNPEELKKLMVLAPNQEVDVAKTFQKIGVVFQEAMPKIQQLIKDLDALLGSAEGQAAANPELARIQELSGMTDEDTTSPRFGGFQQTDHDNGDVTQNYSAGPMDVTQTKDKAGNVIKTNANYDMGMGKLGMGQEKGITSKSWTPNVPSDSDDPITQRDLYSMGNKDKAATYDRAMKQVQANESSELSALLKIAGLR